MRRRPTLLSCLAIALILAACSSDDSSSEETTAPSSTTTTADAATEVCADQEALQSSIDGLKDVDLRAEGTNGLEAALADVKSDLATLEDTVSDAKKPQVEALRDSIDELESAAANVGSGGGAALVPAVTSVATAARTLFESLGEGACD